MNDVIRYEIETTKAGIILDADLVTKVVSTHARKVPTVIVMVAKKNKAAFEKVVEGNKDVLGYRGDPRFTNSVEKDWRRS